MKRFMLGSLLSILFVGQASAEGFFSFMRRLFNLSSSQDFASNSSVTISNGNSVVIINGEVVSPCSTRYPKSDAPPKVVEHEEVKRYSESYEFYKYHRLQARYPFAENGRVVVENFNGEVIVEPSASDEISVKVTLDPPVLESPVRTTIEVDPAGGFAKIRASHDGQPIPIAAIMKILVPRSTSVEVETHNGRVVASDRVGDTNIHTSNGAIEACNLRGATHLRTSNGEIDANNVTGAIDFHTSNGDIDAQNINAVDRLSIKTSNGAINFGLLSAMNIGRANIITSNGRINLALARSLQAHIRGQTSNGPIRGNVWDLTKKTYADATLGNGEMSMNVKTSNSRIDANFR